MRPPRSQPSSDPTDSLQAKTAIECQHLSDVDAETGESKPGAKCGDKAMVVAVVGHTRWSRELLTAALGSTRRIRPVDLGTVPSLSLDRVAQTSPAVLLLDLPVRHAISVVGRIRDAFPALCVIAIAIPNRDSDFLALAEAGVRGFVLEDDSYETLLKEIDSAERGEANLSARITGKLLERIADHAVFKLSSKAGDSLSPRERHVAVLLREGLSNKEIAQRLHIGCGTVKNYVHRILEKLSIHHRWELQATNYP